MIFIFCEEIKSFLIGGIKLGVTIQLKRGSKEAWSKLNPILAIGEPGFEKDTNRFKIGNGSSTWNSLPYQDELNPNVYNAYTSDDFPEVGNSNMIYKALSTAKLYQWNPEVNAYESLSSGGTGGGVDLEDIKLINGGTA